MRPAVVAPEDRFGGAEQRFIVDVDSLMDRQRDGGSSARGRDPEVVRGEGPILDGPPQVWEIALEGFVRELLESGASLIV